ncbi:MAG TPA: metallophosphoesterase family protein [Thermoplasmata archaeon]|nr:metallophosphoesterase family protein [Thermoplasmata archaeon]
MMQLGPEGDVVVTTRTDAKRIAFLSDTHTRAPDGSGLSDSFYEALAGAELIVHLGHVGNPALLDRLSKVAPVLACRTSLDDLTFGPRLEEEVKSGRAAGYVRVMEAPGAVLGAVDDVCKRGVELKLVDETRLAFPDTPTRDVVSSKFGRPVDVVAWANTHSPSVLSREGVLFVNPGSPNYPGGWRKGGPGTFAVLDLSRGNVEAEIIDLARPPKQAAPAPPNDK